MAKQVTPYCVIKEWSYSMSANNESSLPMWDNRRPLVEARNAKKVN